MWRMRVFLRCLMPLLVYAACAASIEQNGSELVLAWNGESRVVYDIAYSNDLATWTNTSPSRTGDGSPIQVPVADILGDPNADRAFFKLATHYQDNEDGAIQDMLTPAYYNAATGDPFRDEVNTFIYHAQREPLHHPLQNGTNAIPAFTVPVGGYFGAGKGPGGTAEHHPAVDLHVGNDATVVDVFAAHGGTVQTYKNVVQKFRHHLSITQSITNNTGQVIGKMVTVYAHLDLNLDEAGGLFMDGQTVNAGDLVSKHLYSGTMGGPHLHFEIRYYRPDDAGDEEFYGFNFTVPSAGPWPYGYWDPNIGYGFGDPKNHGLVLY